MKVTGDEMMARANNVLLSHDQEVLVVNWNGKEIVFNNGHRLTANERGKFISRIFSVKTDLWKIHHDEIFTNPEIIAQIKSALARVGGLKVQEDNGEKIRLNLNTGTPWNKGRHTGQKIWSEGLSKDTDPRLARRSDMMIGQSNPQYGKVYTHEEKNIKSLKMKKIILEGKFTPNSNNRNTHWESSFLDKKYRSSWEAWYQYLSPDSEFETLRIQYEINGAMKIYIVDFIDHLNKTVAEVKPVELTNTELFKAKWNALTLWAESHGYETRLVTAQWLIEHTSNIDYSLFDERTSTKIKKIYEANKKD